ncbi:MAG: hypothetical protein K2I68_04625, partial [Bacteroidales bacterium]|nr:hypothetical protein [Bacteroidales bacterium]
YRRENELVWHPDVDTIGICHHGSTVLSAEGMHTYTWTPMTGLTCRGKICDTVSVNPAKLGDAHWLYLTGTDIYGCQVKDSVFLYGLSADKPEPLEICYGDTAVYDLSEAYRIYDSAVWSPATYLSDSFGLAPAVQSPTVDSVVYTLDLFYTPSGCKQTVYPKVRVRPYLGLDLTASDTVPCVGDSVLLSVVPMGNTAARLKDAHYEYRVVPERPGVTFKDLQQQWMVVDTACTVYVSVTDAKGCHNIDSLALNPIAYDTLQVTLHGADEAAACESPEPWQIKWDVVRGGFEQESEHLYNTNSVHQWLAEGYSTDSIPARGEFTYTVNGNEAGGMIGLSYQDRVNNPTYIDYAFYLTNYGTARPYRLQIYERGVFVAEVGTYNVYDRLTIERNDGYIYYYRSGELVHRSKEHGTGPLHGDVTSYYAHTTFGPAQMLTIMQPYHLTVTAENGGDAPTYSWYVNGQLRSTDTVLSSTVQLHSYDTVVVRVTSSLKCAAFPEVYDTVILGRVEEYERVNIVLSEESGPCTGDSSYITVHTLSAPEGAELNYRFYRNGILYADKADSVMGFANVVRGEIFQAEAYITNMNCVLNHAGYPAVTPILVTDRLPLQPLGVNVDIYPHDSICLYENVHINVAAANGGKKPTIIWFLNGKEVTRERTYTTDSLHDGDSVFVRVKPSADILCPDVDSADSRPLVIKVFESPTVRILQDDTVVDYGEEVLLTAEVQSSMPYTYEWLPAYDLVTPKSLSSIAKPRSSHRYNFRAINELGCYSNEPGVYVEVRTCPAVVARHVVVNSCENDSAVIAIHVVDYNNTAYQYTWQISTDFGATFTDIAPTDTRFVNRGLSLFIPKVTADMDEVEGVAFRCHIASTYDFCDEVYSGPSVLRVTSAPYIKVALLGTKESCRGNEMKFDVMVKGMNPTDKYNLNWYLNDQLFASQVTTVRLNDVEDGDKLNVQLVHATDRCVTLLHAGDSVKIKVYDIPTLTICPDTAVFMGDSAYLYGSMTGAAPYTYSWLPASYLYKANRAASYTRPMTYSRLFSLTGTDANGCDTTAEVLVRVMDSCLLAVDIDGPALICADSLVTYRAIVTGSLSDLDYTVTWHAEPALNGVVDGLNAPFVTVRPSVYTTKLYATVNDISGRAAKCSNSHLTDTIEIMPSKLQTLTARLTQPNSDEFCEGAPIEFKV